MNDLLDTNVAWVVLVVEDDAVVRMVAVDALEDAGFTVVAAENAADALRFLHSGAMVVNALFTDVHMPGERNGVELVHETRRRWPWVRLLVASGMFSPAQGDLPDECGFLAKPYELQRLVTHVLEMAEV